MKYWCATLLSLPDEIKPFLIESGRLSKVRAFKNHLQPHIRNRIYEYFILLYSARCTTRAILLAILPEQATSEIWDFRNSLFLKTVYQTAPLWLKDQRHITIKLPEIIFWRVVKVSTLHVSNKLFAGQKIATEEARMSESLAVAIFLINITTVNPFKK